MSRNPYKDLPTNAFWKTGVSQSNPYQPEGIYEKKFNISQLDKIATAGSCFAQHISHHLKINGYRILDVEPPPATLSENLHKRFGYSMYSARYGNIYTVLQLLQLVQEAAGEWQPQNYIWEKDGRFFDALRPAVQPDGLSSPEEVIEHRQYHISKVKQLFEDLDLFIFTLGLTEMWIHKSSGTVYPAAPGVIAGDFKADSYEFVNADYADILLDWQKFEETARKIRGDKDFNVILTVSPVPLTATASGKHVLVSTAYSKATLRSVAGHLSTKNSNIDYFPSYEIVTNPRLRSESFSDNLRSVRNEMIDNVMRCFLNAHDSCALNDFDVSDMDNVANPEKEENIPCEDMLLESFSDSGATEFTNYDFHIDYEFLTIRDFLSFAQILPGIYCIKKACLSPDMTSYYPLVFEINGKCDNSPLVCNFHGAVNKENVVLPVLTHKVWTQHLTDKATTVSFCDPLLFSKKINTGWYTYHTGDPVVMIAMCIEHISAHCKSRAKILISGSSGGFACLRMTKYLPDATYFLWNCQTNILKYVPQAVKEYVEAISPFPIIDNYKEYLEAQKIEYAIRRGDQFKNFKGKVFYFQQRGDSHVRAHLAPLLAQFIDKSIDKIVESINNRMHFNISDSFCLHVGDWRPPGGKGSHFPPTKKLIQSVSTSLVVNGNLERLDLDNFDVISNGA